MSRNDDIDKAVQEFLANGGEVTQLRFADQRMQDKSRRAEFHSDKAISGSERSKDILERERMREQSMIFSRIDRMKDRSKE